MWFNNDDKRTEKRIKGDDKEKLANLNISKWISKWQILNLHQLFHQHLTSSNVDKGKTVNVEEI